MKSASAPLSIRKRPPFHRVRHDRGMSFTHAVPAFLDNARLFLTREPSTPLRVLSLMALSTALKSRNRSWSENGRRRVIEMMELGALLNDRHDAEPHDRGAIRARLTRFRNSPCRKTIRDYVRTLQATERNRPAHGACPDATRIYREAVNRLSLATMWALATDCHLSKIIRHLHHDRNLDSLFRIIMLIQLIDDVMDHRKDQRRRLPSFATSRDAGLPTWRNLIRRYARPDYPTSILMNVVLRCTGAFAHALCTIKCRSTYEGV